MADRPRSDDHGPGPGTTTPDKTVRLGLATVKRITRADLRRPGLPVAVSALNASSLKLTLKKGTKTVASKTLRASGSTSLKVSSAKKGAYKLTVSGGGKTASKTVQVK